MRTKIHTIITLAFTLLILPISASPRTQRLSP